jgi:proteasome accessory factor C
MDRFERIYQLHHILYRTQNASIEPIIFKIRLECSEVTVKRLVGLMRDHFDAPIVYDRNRNGYYYDTETGAHTYELPGTMVQCRRALGTADLPHHAAKNFVWHYSEIRLRELQNRIEKLLALDKSSAERKLECIKIIPIASRQNVKNPWFAKIASEHYSNNQRLDLIYEARVATEHTSERSVSPQNLVYYRDNWYLDAWCHLRNKLRTFALERIKSAIRQEEPAQSVDRQQLEDYFSAAYGIFSGNAQHIAKLKFTPERARWVADEQWHPKQTGRLHKDGSYELHVPFGDHRELC